MMWTIRLLDRKNGIKKYASGECAHNLIWTSDINGALTFPTRREARSFLEIDKILFASEWRDLKNERVFAKAVKVEVQITEVSQ